jgi:hypothetical protein
MAKKEDPRIDKRRVTMTTYIALADGSTKANVATDYVRPDFLDAYVAKAQQDWQVVEVSDEPDAGPGGYDGETNIPVGIDHPLAGAHFPATGA